MPHTRQDLLRDLQDLGVEKADILFVHSSFKSLGPVAGGAGTVIAALEDAVGEDGLILMPSFNLVEHKMRPKTWDIETTPSTVGWLTEYFWRMPGTCRSDHFSHSVAARGKGAGEFAADHRSREGCRAPLDLEPWGKMYGAHSPMLKAYRADGKLLMLGVDYESSTYVHVVEAIHWDRRLARDPEAEYRWLKRPLLGKFWDSLGRMRRGRVGDSDCRLFSIREYVHTLLQEVERNPGPYIRAQEPASLSARAYGISKNAP